MIAFYGTTLFQEHFVAVAVSEERAAPNATLESNSVLLRRRHSKSNTQYQRRGKTDAGCHRWKQFVDDCKNFLSSPDSLAERAARLGWDAMALFGCAPNRRLDYFGSAGCCTRRTPC
jgi:hypothetical protein